MFEYNQYNDTGYRLQEEYNQIHNEQMRTSPRIPICFCVDVSGSMNTPINNIDTRISLLSKVMKNMLLAMQRDDSALASEAVIAVIAYDRHAHRIQSFLDIQNINPEKATHFYARGQTFMSEALDLALYNIDNKIQQLQSKDNDNYIPMLVFMTDGEAFSCGDDPTRQFDRVRDRVIKKELHVFPIGISQEANMQVLRRLSPTQEVYQINTSDQFITVFDEIRKRAKKKTYGFASDDGVDMPSMVSNDLKTINNSYGELSFLDVDIIDSVI